MLHFAGAASRHPSQRLPETLRFALRRTFSEHTSGTTDIHGSEQAIVLLENRPGCRPARFFHFASDTAGGTLMVSGLVYDGPSGSNLDATALARHLTPFTGIGFAAINGDFSVAAWDHSTARLMLASSFMGVQPLYWTETDAAVFWSSNLAILRACAASRDVDCTYLGTFLVLQRSVERSPYQAIRAVRPGTVLTFEPGDRPRKEDVVTFEDVDLHLRDEREFAEGLNEVVTSAIRDRMPHVGTCFTELSGGLDSSTVAAVASGVGRDTGATLRAVNYTSRSSPEWDETRFARAVATQAGINLEIIDLDDLTFLDLPDDSTPQVPQAGRLAAASLIRASGAEVLLSGRVGDAVFGNTVDNSLAAVDHLRAAEYSRFFHSLLEWSIASNRPLIGLLGATVLAHVAPSWHDRLLEYRRHRRPTAPGGRWDAKAYSVLPAVLANARSRRMEIAGPANRLVRPAKRRLLNTIFAYSWTRALENRLADVLMLYPFVDRRVVTYMLSVPPGLHAQPSETRHLMRRAFGALWPATVRQRIAKGYAQPASRRLIRPHVLQLQAQRDYLLADLRLLDPDAFRLRLRDFVDTNAARVGNLYCIWYAEEWLRRLAGLPSLTQPRETTSAYCTHPTLPQRTLAAERR